MTVCSADLGHRVLPGVGSGQAGETLRLGGQPPSKCACFFPLKRGVKRRLTFLAWKRGANLGLGHSPNRLCDLGHRILLLLSATSASGKGHVRWNDLIDPLRFWSLLIPKAYMNPSQWQVPWSQSHLSHILDNICHYYKCSNFFQFCNILSHFLWFLDFSLNIAIYLPAKFKDC